ncbi:MAG: endonuclease III domain-containing protein [Candidatus Omnitrophota bacterium]
MKNKLNKIYQRLYKEFGPQHWWPGESSFEIMIGAILTQNTNWANVEKAISNLKQKNSLSPNKLYKLSHKRLAQLIRPAGYFNIKAKRIKNFLDFLFKEYKGNIKIMRKVPTGTLRKKLLLVNGIGQETADSILLYALDKSVFVVDAYTKRMLLRHKIIKEETSYEEIQEIFHNNLEQNKELFNEYHALIVRLGKEICKTKNPLCHICPILDNTI